jgi:hypothetical protein
MADPRSHPRLSSAVLPILGSGGVVGLPVSGHLPPVATVALFLSTTAVATLAVVLPRDSIDRRARWEDTRRYLTDRDRARRLGRTQRRGRLNRGQASSRCSRSPGQGRRCSGPLLLGQQSPPREKPSMKNDVAPAMVRWLGSSSGAGGSLRVPEDLVHPGPARLPPW